jgi:hypothetical protein
MELDTVSSVQPNFLIVKPNIIGGGKQVFAAGKNKPGSIAPKGK